MNDRDPRLPPQGFAADSEPPYGDDSEPENPDPQPDWTPDVNTGSCAQPQDDGSWRWCSCPPGKACGFDGGKQHEARADIPIGESATQNTTGGQSGENT